MNLTLGNMGFSYNVFKYNSNLFPQISYDCKARKL
jgi:hypothetical protein